MLIKKFQFWLFAAQMNHTTFVETIWQFRVSHKFQLCGMLQFLIALLLKPIVSFQMLKEAYPGPLRLLVSCRPTIYSMVLLDVPTMALVLKLRMKNAGVICLTLLTCKLLPDQLSLYNQLVYSIL